MAQQNKSFLKTYFQTGDIPSANNYAELIDSSLNLAETNIQVGEFSISSSGNLKIMGSASFVGDITSSGNINSSGKLYGTTLNTGHGDNELYEMNQNVSTNSTVTFSSISLTKTTLSVGHFGGIISTSGQSFTITIDSIPLIPGKASGALSRSIPTTVTNNGVQASSVVIATSTSYLSVSAFKITDGAFQISLSNEAATDFEDGTAVINFIVL
jgi:hypothetical protein